MWTLYDFLDSRGRSVIHRWANSIRLENRVRARLDQKIDMLANSGPELGPRLLGPTKLGHIQRISLRGRLQVRLYLCRGPFDIDNEYTFLFGATERDNRLEPRDAVERAEENRQELIRNPDRRIEHAQLGR